MNKNIARLQKKIAQVGDSEEYEESQPEYEPDMLLDYISKDNLETLKRLRDKAENMTEFLSSDSVRGSGLEPHRYALDLYSALGTAVENMEDLLSHAIEGTTLVI